MRVIPNRHGMQTQYQTPSRIWCCMYECMSKAQASSASSVSNSVSNSVSPKGDSKRNSKLNSILNCIPWRSPAWQVLRTSRTVLRSSRATPQFPWHGEAEHVHAMHGSLGFAHQAEVWSCFEVVFGFSMVLRTCILKHTQLNTSVANTRRGIHNHTQACCWFAVAGRGFACIELF